MNLLRMFGLNRKKPKKRPINLAFEYGTHLPVVRSIVEVFQPQGVLELGAGKFSTPFFHQHVQKVVTIESDAAWIAEVMKLLPPREHFSMIHHLLPHLTSRTGFWAISQRIKSECINYYREVLKCNPGLDFLFIDHISGLRATTLFELYDRFDFVVYHDAEDKGYGYEQFPQFDNKEFFHYVFRAYLPHTGILIRRKFAPMLDQFKRVLDQNALAYFLEQYRFDLHDLTGPSEHKCA